jgi:hypothetical protein
VFARMTETRSETKTAHGVVQSPACPTDQRPL